MGSSPATASVRSWRPARLLGNRDRWLVAGALAFLSASLPFFARLVLNARGPSPLNLGEWMHTFGTFGIVGPALAAGLLAVTADDDIEAIGLTFVAVFGLLAVVSPAATIPALAAVVGGGSLATMQYLDRSGVAVDWTLTPVVLIVAGVVCSALGSIGIASGLTRPVGTHLALLGAAGTPAMFGHRRRDWALGGVVAGLLVAVGVAAPFVTGAVALVGGGVVGANLVVMAVGICGLVTAGSAAIGAREPTALFGVGLLLVAGVPATFPRAMAAVFAVVLLVEARYGGVSP